LLLSERATLRQTSLASSGGAEHLTQNISVLDVNFQTIKKNETQAADCAQQQAMQDHRINSREGKTSNERNSTSNKDEHAQN
jgi:hypothetical protein